MRCVGLEFKGSMRKLIVPKVTGLYCHNCHTLPPTAMTLRGNVIFRELKLETPFWQHSESMCSLMKQWRGSVS